MHMYPHVCLPIIFVSESAGLFLLSLVLVITLRIVDIYL